MENPYQPPADKSKRHFKTPITVPILTLFTFLSSAFLFVVFEVNHGGDISIDLINLAFPVFMMTQLTIVAIMIFCVQKLDYFLKNHSKVDSVDTFNELKAMARENMYFSLAALVLNPISFITGITVILTQGIVLILVTMAMFLVLFYLEKRAKKYENQIKEIDCIDEYEEELNDVLQCWMNKPFPNF